MPEGTLPQLTPFWESDDAVLYHGDCRDILPLISSVDLLLTDPPYGVEYQSGWSNDPRIPGDDGSLDVQRCVGLSLSKLGVARHAYVFGSFDFSGLKITKPVQLIWDKVSLSGGDLASPWGKQHEPIMFFANANRASRHRGKEGLAAKLRKGSILRYQRRNGRKGLHPTEKPVMLLQELIESSSRFGDTVLDPFAGSGSTLVAAMREGRKSIGIELEKSWCEKAAERLEAERRLSRRD